MTIKKLFIAIICLYLIGLPQGISGQSVPKQVTIHRIDEAIKIDGKLEEPSWHSNEASIATDFICHVPVPGVPSAQRTEVRLLLDDEAIYVGVRLYDTEPDSILKELTQRDNFGNADWFGVAFSPYHDGQNGLGFGVTASGVQRDVKYSSNWNNGSWRPFLNGDQSWDAVWESNIAMDAQGWTVELRIPFYSLRFPDQTEEQIWNINFCRNIRRTREESYWNLVDPEVSGFLTQFGQLHGIREVQQPLRLSATPYVAVSLEDSYDPTTSPNHNLGRGLTGGMDVKYGITDAFTLDMTLIPDFGQVQFDNQVVNLSPFEVRFEENRPFFTEGTELFSRGNLFYSRRIGSQPFYYNQVADGLDPDEYIADNPTIASLINATKVSGRNPKGLGIGVFNAVEAKEYARIRNADGEERTVLTNPLTNYNLVVFDQTLKHNSNVYFSNANVIREGTATDANVMASGLKLRDKDNNYEIGLKGAWSRRISETNDDGFAYSIALDKISGQWNYGGYLVTESDRYNPNDLGFLYSPNEFSWGNYISFNQYQPFGIFNSADGGIFFNVENLYAPREFSSLSTNLYTSWFTKDFFAFGGNGTWRPIESKDWFESRVSGQPFIFPPFWNMNWWISTDYRKAFALDLNAGMLDVRQHGRYGYWSGFSPRFRFNDHFSLTLNVSFEKELSDQGWTGFDADDPTAEGLTEDDIIIGTRDLVTVENGIYAKYAFNANTNIILRGRHYWRRVNYTDFGILQPDGHLADTDYYNPAGHNVNRSFFNIDVVFNWRFAPGSDLFITFKNAIGASSQDFNIGYLESSRGLFNQAQNNSLSVKAVYFLNSSDVARHLKR